MRTKRHRVLEASGELEWAGRRMMEFRTVLLVVNWMQEEGLCGVDVDPLAIAKRFTDGPKSKARTVFQKAMVHAMDGMLKTTKVNGS